MKCKVLETFKVRSSKVVLEFQPGQTVILPEEIALKLMEESRIVSLEKGSYKGYSDVLKDSIWIVEDKDDMKALRASWAIAEPIYMHDELRMMQGLDKGAIEVIKNVKEIFDLSTVEEVIKVDSGI